MQLQGATDGVFTPAMIQKPTRDHPEQYRVFTTTKPDRVHVCPRTTPSNKLDKWVFLVKEDDEVVIDKHIGGKKYRANHTVPDKLPKVIRDALRQNGYEVRSPETTVLIVEDSKVPSYATRRVAVPLDEDDNPQLDDLYQSTKEYVVRELGLSPDEDET